MEDVTDRCPYERPFADDFSECPAYQPVRYVPLDLTHAPLQPVWTCGHLDTSRHAGGGFYASCRLGDAASRAAWVQRIAADRLESWKEIAREFGIALAEPLTALLAAKARQLELENHPGAARDAAVKELRLAAEHFLAIDFELMDVRTAELERIGFPIQPLRTVTALAMADMQTRATLSGGFIPPEAVMAAFPTETRAFLVGLFMGAPVGEGVDAP